MMNVMSAKASSGKGLPGKDDKIHAQKKKKHCVKVYPLKRHRSSLLDLDQKQRLTRGYYFYTLHYIIFIIIIIR